MFGIAMLGMAWVVRDFWFVAMVVAVLRVILMGAGGFYRKIARDRKQELRKRRYSLRKEICSLKI